VAEKAFKGAEIHYTLQPPSGNRVLSLFPSHRNHSLGEQVRVRSDAQHLTRFPHQA
jgi:iron(III) transport system ATP-binding protein